MKYTLLCLSLFTCSLFASQNRKEDIRQKNPSKVQIIFEVSKDHDVNEEVWQYIMDCMLDLYTPSLSSDTQLDQWIVRFNDMIKKVAYVSAKTNKTHGKLTFRFVTD
ncbi:MAG: hypothetical protein WD055_01175 [Candidatus Dependentiae bacterium]